MKTFKDKNELEWTLDLTYYDFQKMKDLLGFDVLSVIGGNDAEGMNRLTTDISLLVDMIYVCCKDQADAKGLDDVAFGKSFDGDTIHRAMEAFQGALTDFFPKDRQEAVRILIGRTREAQNLGTDLMLKHLTTEKMTALLENRLRQVGFGTLDTEQAVSSESTSDA